MAEKAFFLIDGVPGDSSDSAHQGWFDAADIRIIEGAPPMVPVAFLTLSLLGSAAVVNLARAAGTKTLFKSAILKRIENERVFFFRAFYDLYLIRSKTQGRSQGRTVEVFDFSFDWLK